MKRKLKNSISKYGNIFGNSIKHFLVLFLLLGLVFSCSSDNGIQEPETPDESEMPEEPETPEEPLAFKAELDVLYGNDTKQAYDIYLPEGRSPETKVLILVHGGGWTSGDKADMNDFKDFLRIQLPKIAVVNINYRLADESNPPYPMQTDDISAVMADLKDKVEEYQIGSDIGFVGISAGAHLSLLWSYALDNDENVKMVCSIVGPTNLLDEAYQNSDDEVLQELINQFSLSTEILEEASPLFQVKTSSPPTILFYGGEDPLIPDSQGIDLDAKLTELDVEHEFTFYENEGHGWVGTSLFDTSVKLKAFIEKHL